MTKHKFYVYKEIEVPTGQYKIANKVYDIPKDKDILCDDPAIVQTVTKSAFILVCETCGKMKIEELKINEIIDKVNKHAK